MRAHTISRVTIVMAGVLLGAVPLAASAQGGIPAVWTNRHLRFIYQGFTTYYSCGGLREEVERMLQKLGARDLKVNEYGCVRGSGVETFPGVQVSMQVLVPASSKHGKAVGPEVSAHWQNVVLLAGNSSLQDQGNCELIEQFKETFLPLFTTRNIRYESTCVPHQVNFGTHLSTEVLMADAQPVHGH
ncbi:MAG: hypothetical protein ACP5P4_16695 [Steroidobacteraceae bacterium]